MLGRLLATAMLGTALSVSAATPALPDLGASDSTVLTPEQEERIGRTVLRRIREARRLVDDPELNRYVTALGNRLAVGADFERRFTFFIVDDPSVNAFALPSGYIGIHSGLLLATRNEAELAAVLAHEIAHVTQHHIARGVEKSESISLPMTAAVIAAILLGAQDPQLAEATLAATTAGAAQFRLNFTRTHEQEADHVGIELLSAAGYDPGAMGRFFEVLGRQTRYYGGKVPEFLRTHPVTENRIAEAQNRAAGLPPGTNSGDGLYEAAKAKMRVLAGHPGELIQVYEQRRGDGDPSLYERYAHGLALLAAGRAAEARQELARCTLSEPRHIPFLLARARAERQSGATDVAVATLEATLRLYPGNPLVALELGETHLVAGTPAAARQALEPLTHDPNAPAVAFLLLSEVEGRLGHPGAAQLALANYHALLGETYVAIDHLQAALKTRKLDFYYASRIEARLDQLRREAELEGRDGDR